MRDLLDKLFREALRTLAQRDGLSGLASLDTGLERSRDTRHGDFTSNVALRAAKGLDARPRELAEKIVASLPTLDEIDSIEIAGPGFINLRLAPHAYHEALRDMLRQDAAFGTRPSGSGQKVLVEYVSANPTGPLHVGHGRHAAYGASVAALLRAAGHTVDEEYYVNDAGRQMDILAVSVWLRYSELNGEPLDYPSNCYQGAYVRDIATALSAAHGRELLGDGPSPDAIAGDDDEARLDALIAAVKEALGPARFRVVLDAALGAVLDDIRSDLEEFGAAPPSWFSERSLIDGGAIEAALETLRANGALYDRDGATWFRTTDHGDDKDRVVVRENGATTYFASDIAYHLDKCERGYDLLLNVLGSDHHGYVERLTAAVEAFGHPRERLEVRLVQFVVLFRGKVKAQMSTRSGDYVTLRELRDEVGNDAARFFYVSRSNDQHLEFDLELAKSQTNENPVYYVQYAHARIASMLQKLTDAAGALPDAAATDLAALDQAQELELMRLLSRYPEIVELAADNRSPQHLVHYLRELAAVFHSYYNAQRILVDDASIRDARVLLSQAVQLVIRNALAILGVSAPDKM